MGISEFAVHNVLRTYNRQERLGRIQRPREGPGATKGASDQVTLSAAARKAQSLRLLAVEVASREQPDLDAGEVGERAKGLTAEFLSRHRDDVADDGLTPEAFESTLQRLYGG